MRIRLKKEIVTIGDKSIQPIKMTGKYIDPKKWDTIVNNKNYLLIDTRNNYEIKIGSFKDAINPNIDSFREFPKFINQKKISKDQPIAMFCTGGIRCEKASSYLLKKGYKNIYQLNGGILNYLEYKKDKKNSTWKGECLVFDNRVSVNKNLSKGTYDQCYGCRHPITNSEINSKKYKKGVFCPYCYDKRSEIQKIKSETRQRNINILEAKKKSHTFKKIFQSDIAAAKKIS